MQIFPNSLSILHMESLQRVTTCHWRIQVTTSDNKAHVHVACDPHLDDIVLYSSLLIGNQMRQIIITAELST